MASRHAEPDQTVAVQPKLHGVVTFPIPNKPEVRLKVMNIMQKINIGEDLCQRLQHHHLLLFVWSFKDNDGTVRLYPGELMQNIPHNAEEITLALSSSHLVSSSVLEETARKIIQTLGI